MLPLTAALLASTEASVAGGLPAWPFHLGIALWTGVVLVHGILRARRTGSPEAG